MKSTRRKPALLVATLVALVAGGWWVFAATEMPLPDDPNRGPVARQIIVNPTNPSWLIRETGEPVFICGPGDPEDFLYRGVRQDDGTRDGDQLQLIDNLVEHGGNCIYMQAIRSHGGDGQSDHNPFVDSDPSRGIDEDIVSQWEQWFRLMDRHSIVIYLFLYDDGADIWNTWRHVGRAEQAFVEQLVDRFEHHANLIWVIAEEYYEDLSVPRVKRLAAIIRAADDHDHPIAVHKLHGLSFSEFADDPNIDQFAIQWNKPTVEELHQGVLRARHLAQGRYSLNMSEAQQHLQQMNEKNWACAMAGAYVMVLGMDIASTSPELLSQCRHLQNFFESTDFQDMKPRGDLSVGSATYVLAGDESYIVFCEDKGAAGVKDLPAGDFELTWLDCQSGQRQYETVTSTGRGFHPPDGIATPCALWIRQAQRITFDED